jgi:hypothetical protein
MARYGERRSWPVFRCGLNHRDRSSQGAAFACPACTWRAPGQLFGLDNLPTLPAGLVNPKVPDPFVDKSLMPQAMYAVYIPKGQETDLVSGGDPEAFLASSFAKGSANLNLNGATDKYQIAVPGVAPGNYFVQVVYEYAA